MQRFLMDPSVVAAHKQASAENTLALAALAKRDMDRANEVAVTYADAPEPEPNDDKDEDEWKRPPRMQAAGTSTALRAIDVARGGRPPVVVVLVSLSWRHSHAFSGVDRVITVNEPRGAAFDLRPPPKPKKGEPKEKPSTLGPDELSGLINAGDMIAELLLDDMRTHVVVMDGYPRGETYARFALAIAARCIKLERRSKAVVMPRMTAPADATCKALLARFKSCRSVDAMHVAALDYYNEHLADCFP